MTRLQQLISFHDSPHEYTAFISKYRETIPTEIRKTCDRALSQGLNMRAFVGFMPGEMVRAQEKVLRKQDGPHRYFVYFSQGKPGLLTLSLPLKTESYDRKNFRYNASTWRELNEKFRGHQLMMRQRPQPMDRGKCIMFSARTKEQAKKAIDAWCLCAKRMGLVKDVATLIAKMLWQEFHVWMP